MKADVAYQSLRSELPTTLRKLTAGYELRTFWFEIFECLRKVLLVGLPVFFPSGEPSQLILGLVICFLTYGAYCVFSPYIDYDNDFLAQVAQIVIFFSLISSIITNSYPDDPVLSTLLPAFLVVPPSLAIVFESPLFNELRKVTEPDENGNVSCFGRCFLSSRHAVIASTDWILGTDDEASTKRAVRRKLRGKTIEKKGPKVKSSLKEISFLSRSTTSRGLMIMPTTQARSPSGLKTPGRSPLPAKASTSGDTIGPDIDRQWPAASCAEESEVQATVSQAVRGQVNLTASSLTTSRDALLETAQFDTLPDEGTLRDEDIASYMDGLVAGTDTDHRRDGEWA